MNPDAEQVLVDPLRLPPQARAALAAQLIESLEQEVDEDSEAAWSASTQLSTGAEIARRVEGMEAGRVKTEPWPEAGRRILGLSSGSKVS